MTLLLWLALALMVGRPSFAHPLPPMTSDVSRLPLLPVKSSIGDWLVRRPVRKAGLYQDPDGHTLHLDNGLVRRSFRIAPNAVTVALEERGKGVELLRAVKPEAELELDGVRYPVGGLSGQPDGAYLSLAWLDSMTADPGAFRCIGFTVGKTAERFPWKRPSGPPDSGKPAPWPPPGVALTLTFAPPRGRLGGVTVAVHYELYDGLPLFSKWLTLRNEGARPVRLNRIVVERLGVVEAESVVDAADRWRLPNMTVLTDYSFGGDPLAKRDGPVRWLTDPEYATQVNYLLQTPCLLEVAPPLGPDVEVNPDETFESFRVFELLHDSTDRERQGLAIRRMFRTLAPWAMENPFMHHLTDSRPEAVRLAVDQCAAVGFERVILSFGSGLNMEDDSAANLSRYRELAEYAHERGVSLGGYSLLASRHISDEDDVISPKTMKPGDAIFGQSPCLGSRWGIDYFRKLRHFLKATRFDLLEHDGSYPGDVCASTTHPGHRGLDDSQWTQYVRIADFYRECRAQGISLNVPDWYFLVGSTKVAMGYRETNWSLPRARQHIHARQNLYDGTWEKTPSMGWMFVPLSEYHGGGAAATLEPLKDHLEEYEQHLANTIGYGAQACYRGPRLFDSPETEALVKRWVAFHKRYRALLESDVIHLRRADGRDWDGVLHVNPTLPQKGLAALYNPTDTPMTRVIPLPLYYTGLRTKAIIRMISPDAPPEGGAEKTLRLTRDGAIRPTVTLPAHGCVFLLIR